MQKIFRIFLILSLVILSLVNTEDIRAGAEVQVYPDNLGRTDTLRFNYKETHTKSGDTDCFDANPQELEPPILRQEGDGIKTYEQSNLAWWSLYSGEGCQSNDWWIFNDHTLNSHPGRATANWAAQRIAIPANVGKITRVTFYQVYTFHNSSARFKLELHDGNTDALLNQTGEQAFSNNEFPYMNDLESIGPITFNGLNWTVNPNGNYFLRLVRTDGSTSLPLLSPCKGGWYPEYGAQSECTFWWYDGSNGDIPVQQDQNSNDFKRHNTVDAYPSGFANSDSPRFLDISRSGGTVKADVARMAVWGTLVDNPQGNFEGGSCTAMTGWTCDADNYDASLQVDFYMDGPTGQGTKLGSATANIGNRPDAAAIANQCGGRGNHGFSFAAPNLPALWDNKPHNIYAYGININNGTDTQLTGSPLPITCGIPSVSSLQISNGGSGGNYKMSGLQALTAEGGSGYYNPIIVNVNATKGQAEIKQYFVAFYNPALYSSSIDNTSLMNFLRQRLDNDPTKGFMLAYGYGSPLPGSSSEGMKHYVLSPYMAGGLCTAKWEALPLVDEDGKISAVARDGFDVKDCASNIFYKVYPLQAHQWRVRIFKPLGTKKLNTAVQVFDTADKTGFDSNINPVP